MSNNDHLLVVTYLWRDPQFKFRSHFKYGPEHVIALYRQLKRFLHVPFYFTVVCDVPMLKKVENWTTNYQYDMSLKAQIDDPDLNRIDAYRIWDDYQDMGRCWRRLRGFSAYEFGHLSRVLFIDLDMLIMDDITSLVTDNAEHPFVIADDSICNRSKYNGSFVLFTPTPTTHKIWEKFNADPHGAADLMKQMGYLGSDQAWIRHYLDSVKYPVKTIGADEGLLSFRWHCMGQDIDPFEAGAKMVNFHGPYMPDMPEIQEQFRWSRVYNSYSWQAPKATGRENSLKNLKPFKKKPPPTMENEKAAANILRNGGTNAEAAEPIGCHGNYMSQYLKSRPVLLRAKIEGLKRNKYARRHLDRYILMLKKLEAGSVQNQK